MSWVIRPRGFTSAVSKVEGEVCVRARDLDSLFNFCDDAGVDRELVREGGGTDYPYRVDVTPAEYERFMIVVARETLEYENMKNAAMAERGAEYAHALSDVWVDLLKLTPEGAWSSWRSYADVDWDFTKPRNQGKKKRKK